MLGRPLSQTMRHIRSLLAPAAAADKADQELLASFAQTRDEAAFDALVRRHGPLVWGVCRRVLGNDADAEDAFQASFLVLAQKAGTNGWRTSVAGWIYRVASHIAMRSKRAAARRRQHEQRVPPMAATRKSEWAELGPVLDEELNRLPEKYRLPLLLCCLEGKSREQAAETFGWTASEVKGRLERGREMLRRRLDRRGIAIPAAAFAAVLGQEAAAATMPSTLISKTVDAAVHGTASAAAIGLMKGALQAMFFATLRKAGVLVLAAVVALGSGAWLLQREGSIARAVPLPPAADKAPEKAPPRTSEPVEKNGLSVTVTPAKAKFVYGDPLEFTVTLKNVSNKPFGICMVPFETRFGDWKMTPLFDSKLSYAIILFKPGEEQSQSVKVELKRYDFRWVGDQTKRVPPVASLPEGKYPLVVDLSYGLPPQGRADGKFAHPLWTGGLTTKPVEIEIVKDDGSVSWGEARDGLRMGLSPANVAVGPDAEEIKVNLWYENVGTDICSFTATDNFYFPIGFVVTRDGKSSDVPCQLQDVKGVPKEKTVRLAPKAVHREQAVLRFERADGKDGFGFIRLPRPTEGKPLTLTAYRRGEGKGKNPAPRSGEITIALAAKAISWGAPKDDVRIGLTPEKVEVAADARDVAVTLWYENVGKEERKVLTFQGGNVSPLMFTAGKGDKVSFVEFAVERLAITVPKYVTLKPGERFSEGIRIPFELHGTGGFLDLPRPEAKQPVSLKAALGTKGDARGKDTWDSADTRHSGLISIELK